MAKSDEILLMATEAVTQIKALKHRLYGEEADCGDIPEIRKQLQKLNGNVFKHEGRISGLEATRSLLLKLGIPLTAAGGGIAGILKLTGVY